MAQEDYPYCIFCDQKVTNIVVQNDALVYLCACCDESVTVMAGD